MGERSPEQEAVRQTVLETDLVSELEPTLFHIITFLLQRPR